MLVLRRFTPILMIFAISAISCSLPPRNTQSQEILAGSETTMLTPTNTIIQRVNLLAREENLPPPGVIPDPDRDIGFATVFIYLENKYQKDIKVKVNRVEILNVSDETLQDFSSPPKDIHLKPLENSEISFDLSNKTGYVGQDRVKAVVTYQIGDRINIIESEPVEVDRY